MKLNHVESFYAFLLHFRSEGNEEEGQQGMARPLARGRATAKAPLQRGGHPQGQQPPAGTTDCGQPARGYHLRPGRKRRHARKRRPPAASSQGAVRLQGGGPPTASPVACAGAAVAAMQRGAKRGLGHPFEKRMILPL
ncbi:hypothetical protein BHM03_00062941 [Ensete ventricosum]|nr:hypothetical protein BHM03_00062941 [Ensete ventricosum]